MFRIPTSERARWRQLANDYGFKFHTLDGEPYWDESAYYQFTLEQVENDIEDPTAEIHHMCLAVVDKVVRDEYWLQRFQIPESLWELVLSSWQRSEQSLYSRLDFAYDGQSPAKLYENNADTPTSLYETGFWQWIWLEQKVDSGELPRAADQFTLLQELLIQRFRELSKLHPGQRLYFSCCKGTEEDRGTVQYLEDCAREAGLLTGFVFVEDIGVNTRGEFTDLSDRVIRWLFKLYPWEFMFRETFSAFLSTARVNWLEPLWKSVLSNKALLPLLWQMYPEHPNLLPAFFADDPGRATLKDYVVKPIFSREGANISVIREGRETLRIDGPYGEEGMIYQACHPLPRFGENYTLVGSWLVNDKPAGISLREDRSLVTQDSSRYLPHIILN